MSSTSKRKKAVKELSEAKKQALVARLMEKRSCAGCESCSPTCHRQT